MLVTLGQNDDAKNLAFESALGNIKSMSSANLYKMPNLKLLLEIHGELIEMLIRIF